MKVNIALEINRKTVTAFVLGALLSAIAGLVLFRHLQLTVKHAKVVYETDKSATIIFYHDHTDQVIRLKVPVEKYPIPYNGRAVVNTPTVPIWLDDDMEAARLMETSAFDDLQDKLVPRPDWRLDK